MAPHLSIICALAVLPVVPCIWDSDTLDDELRGLPTARALMTGRWYRHGPAYYRARLERLPAHLEAHPTDLAAYDDLAVAHERLGDRPSAIAVMSEKAKALSSHEDKEHRYRLHANLGTFFAHSGDLDRAITEINKAIAINPNAHFGREIWQKNLIRYVRDARANPDLWKNTSAIAYELDRDEIEGIGIRKELHDEIVEAYMGMMRFGGIEGAELYRSLAVCYHIESDYHLAWWAYHRAIDRDHPAADTLREKIRSIENHWNDAWMPEIPTESDFLAVRDNGNAWLAAFHAAEVAAIQRGKDPGQTKVLERLIATANREVPELDTPAQSWLWRTMGQPDLVDQESILKGIVIVVTGGLVLWLLRRQRRTQARSETARPG